MCDHVNAIKNKIKPTNLGLNPVTTRVKNLPQSVAEATLMTNPCLDREGNHYIKNPRIYQDHLNQMCLVVSSCIHAKRCVCMCTDLNKIQEHNCLKYLIFIFFPKLLIMIHAIRFMSFDIENINIISYREQIFETKIRTIPLYYLCTPI